MTRPVPASTTIAAAADSGGENRCRARLRALSRYSGDIGTARSLWAATGASTAALAGGAAAAGRRAPTHAPATTAARTSAATGVSRRRRYFRRGRTDRAYDRKRRTPTLEWPPCGRAPRFASE